VKKEDMRMDKKCSFVVDVLKMSSLHKWPSYVWQRLMDEVVVPAVGNIVNERQSIVIGGKRYDSIYERLPEFGDEDAFVSEISGDEALEFIKKERSIEAISRLMDDAKATQKIESSEDIAAKLTSGSTGISILQARYLIINDLLDIAVKYEQFAEEYGIKDELIALSRICFDAYGHIMVLSASDFNATILECSKVVESCNEKMHIAESICKPKEASKEGLDETAEEAAEDTVSVENDEELDDEQSEDDEDEPDDEKAEEFEDSDESEEDLVGAAPEDGESGKDEAENANSDDSASLPGAVPTIEVPSSDDKESDDGLLFSRQVDEVRDSGIFGEQAATIVLE
jgi:hypothetical protein